MAIELSAVDHVYLTVSDFARAEQFYDRVMEALGFHKSSRAIANEPHCHYYNRQFQITIRPARSAGARHDPYAPGLHHLSMRAADNVTVDEIARTLRSLESSVKARGLVRSMRRITMPCSSPIPTGFASR